MRDAAAVDPARPSRATSVLLPALLVVLVGVLVATSVLLWQDRGEAEDEVRSTGSAAGVTVARQTAVAFFSLDHRTIDADLQRVVTLGTADFASTYRQQAAALEQRIVSRRLVVTASVPADGVAIEYAGADTMQVLVALDVRSGPMGEARPVQDNRVVVRLERVGREWRVSDLRQVG